MHKTISVFFSGTGHEITNPNMLATLLKNKIQTSDNQLVMGFNGCGIDYGARGSFFGAGLDKQCQQVIEALALEIKQGNTITLNVYGHSRGGIAALMLAKELSNVDPNLLTINLALLDPVPGNLITTSTLDPFEISLTNKTMDLRACKPLQQVLALYPHSPLPDIAGHAPLFCLYPAHTMVEEEAVAGCHARAQLNEEKEGILSFRRDSFITFARMLNFLRDNGSEFTPFPIVKIIDADHTVTDTDEKTLNEALLVAYEKENIEQHQTLSRSCHSAHSLCIATKENARYFNLHHQRLAGVLEDKSSVRVSIEEDQSLLSQIKRATLKYPKTWQAIKWTLLSLAATGLLVSTAGLGAFGALNALELFYSTLALSPMLGTGAALLWYYVIKPVVQLSVTSFNYPLFEIRDIHPEPNPKKASTHRLVDALGLKEKNSETAHPTMALESKKDTSTIELQSPIDNTMHRATTNDAEEYHLALSL